MVVVSSSSSSSSVSTSASAALPFVLLLPPQHALQEPDVLDGELEDLALAELLVQRVGREEAAQLGEGAAHVLLAEALAVVGEHLPGVGRGRGGKGGREKEKEENRGK